MKRMIRSACAIFAMLVASGAAFGQVKMTHDQMLFYTSEWEGDRFPDGRPRVPDSLLKRAVSMTIEDVWEYLRAHGYRNPARHTAMYVPILAVSQAARQQEVI